jgi:hypothetical protein
VVIFVPTAATTQAAEIKNAARLFGALGAILGLMLGLVGGWSRGSVVAGCVAAPVGLVAGGVTGAVGPLIVVRAYFRWFGEGTDELLYAMAMHSALWIALGAAAGLALAIGRGSPRVLARAALGGATGAVLGAVLYDLLGAIAFPFAHTGDPLATTSVTRLIELLVPAIAIALGAARGARA